MAKKYPLYLREFEPGLRLAVKAYGVLLLSLPIVRMEVIKNIKNYKKLNAIF